MKQIAIVDPTASIAVTGRIATLSTMILLEGKGY